MQTALIVAVAVLSISVVSISLGIHFGDKSDNGTKALKDAPRKWMHKWTMSEIHNSPPEKDPETVYAFGAPKGGWPFCHRVGRVTSLCDGHRFVIVRNDTNTLLMRGNLKKCVACVGSLDGSMALVAQSNGFISKYGRGGKLLSILTPKSSSSVVNMTATETLSDIFVHYNRSIVLFQGLQENEEGMETLLYEFDQSVSMRHLNEKGQLVIRDKRSFYVFE